MTAKVASGRLDHRRLQADSPEAGHGCVDVVTVHRLVEQSDALDLRLNLDGPTAAAGDFQAFDDRHSIAVDQQIADSVTDATVIGRERLAIAVCGG